MAQLPPEVTAYLKRITSNGGKARMAMLTPAGRRALAAKAGKARWAKARRGRKAAA